MNTFRNQITELVFIMDRSGSMAGLEADTIGGFNAMIKKQIRQEGEAYVSTVLFSDSSKVLHDRVPLKAVRPMTENDYQVYGCTALLDAIGGAIRHIRNIHKYARPEDVPARTIFIITTDGMENSSRLYTADRIKQMIEQQKREADWEFLFLGANIDAVSTASRYGISADRAVRYHADSTGTAVNADAINEAVSSVRSGYKLNAKWKESIERDYNSRERGNDAIQHHTK